MKDMSEAIVRVKHEDGYAVISATDFNEAVHERYDGEVTASTSELPDAPTPELSESLGNVLKGTVGDVKALIVGITAIEPLEQLLAVESAAQKRKTVVEALAARIAELKPKG